MSDFEKIWQEILIENFQKMGSTKTIKMLENGNLEQPKFSTIILKKLKLELGEEKTAEAMMNSSCEYPQDDLEDIKAEFQRSRDLKKAHQMLQKRFEYYLEKVLHLDQEYIIEIQKKYWGAAGKLTGNTIIATKIPKSNHIKDYFNEPDPEKRRQLYCHCPHIRDHIGIHDIDDLHCYCGAGFYKKIWEYITGRNVTVIVLHSIIKGDDFCQFKLEISESQIVNSVQ
ncbi:MAG: hypothetical protein K9N06_12865 [Candidatus Cloacimonetes bacterium]|nr:hypothetical protein [Candidatus Cloacimonadota bacterium]